MENKHTKLFAYLQHIRRIIYENCSQIKVIFALQEGDIFFSIVNTNIYEN